MKTIATINQNTFTEYRNDEQISRYHDYELKFEGKEHNSLMGLFERFIEDHNGRYDIYEGRNNGDMPEKYSCWCSAMTNFLLDKGFELHSITNKTHIFTK